MQSFEYIIKDETGIHARPAGLLVKKASELSSTITIKKDEKSVNATKLFALMGLAVKCGDKITVNVSGDKENEDAEAMKKFFEETL